MDPTIDSRNDGKETTMCEKPNFYICRHCGNIVTKVKDSGVPVICCGEPMSLIKANTTDAAQEKHVPVIKQDGDKVTVTVGSTLHPMTEEHHIAWIVLETTQGSQRKCLKPTGEPTACFSLCKEEKVIAAYEYCNLHGLWMAEMQQKIFI